MKHLQMVYAKQLTPHAPPSVLPVGRGSTSLVLAANLRKGTASERLTVVVSLKCFVTRLEMPVNVHSLDSRTMPTWLVGRRRVYAASAVQSCQSNSASSETVWGSFSCLSGKYLSKRFFVIPMEHAANLAGAIGAAARGEREIEPEWYGEFEDQYASRSVKGDVRLALRQTG